MILARLKIGRGDPLDFYEMLGRYYDVIFPANEKQLAFLKHFLPERGRVLDVGCATGTYAIPLARMGYDVCAFDLDSPMVESMVAKTEGDDNPPRALVYDMSHLSGLNVGSFDLVYSIGNTLVHLDSLEAVDRFLTDVRDKLNEGGALVIQIVNYDRVLQRHDLSLPLIERQEGRVQFRRVYELTDSRIVFHGHLEIEGQGALEASTTLLPVLSEDLMSSLNRAGYREVKLYGGFDGSEHTLESPATVVVAIR
jgi:SAM-dependent methyltransferase